MNYQNGEHHWYGSAHPNQDKYEESNFTKKIKMFDVYSPYSGQLFNCSKTSALTQFEHRDIEEVLKHRGIFHKVEPTPVVNTALRNRINVGTYSSCPVYPTSSIDKLSKVNGMLDGKRVFVLGSGPSLIGFDFNRLDNEETIAVNHTIEHYQKCKHHLFGDSRVYDYVKHIYDNGYKGNIFASHHADLAKLEEKDDRMFVFAKNWNRVTDCIEDGLYSDFNSGMEAVNLALVMGAKEIYLLGLDFCANNGEYYFYGRPKWYTQSVEAVDKLMDSRVQYWEKFAPYHDRIFNCSTISRIKVFQYRDIKEVLNDKSKAVVA
jgi:uncharacterized Rossmann fold enzyme